MNIQVFPWFDSVWSQLVQRRGALPHALLFTGKEGIGKQDLARSFAISLLCKSPSSAGAACGRCNACHWVAQGNHPDFRLVAPEADDAGQEAEGRAATTTRPSRWIRIHQVRDLQDWLAVGAHQSGWRIALIVPAEAMNPSTSNALLKTLEEPPALTLLMLVSHEPSRLLPTIRSRCQEVRCATPAQPVAVRWLAAQGLEKPEERLALASGAPLRARDQSAQEEAAHALAEAMDAEEVNPFRAAVRLAAFPIGLVIDLLQKWIYDLYCARQALPVRYYTGHAALAARTGPRVRTEKIFEFDRRLAEARRLSDHPLNPRLVIEELLYAYADVLSPRRSP